MMPVMMPEVGGMPEAMATPMHSGRATRKTTNDAMMSRPTGLAEPLSIVVAVTILTLPHPRRPALLSRLSPGQPWRVGQIGVAEAAAKGTLVTHVSGGGGSLRRRAST